ncbi:MAG TPA: Gfo/Idh/MocA family oxidoreductase [Bryobacteraceae bacterium]|jgi:predicted dehydrogenase|nr:Gfo/Idh/MocA family oxidoreductase [Bryobacteraceae bacterium]
MKLNRRAFFSTAMLTAASAKRVLGANDNIRLAGIGVGNRGAYDLGLAAKAERTEVVAVADVYAPRLAEIKEKLAPAGKGYKDYRELLDRKDIDAVLIGSPDHWHVPMIIDAVRAGKDVYCEKPVSHSIQEGETLLAAVAGSKQVIQIGYQQRSWPHYQAAAEIVASGRLGSVPLIQSSWYQAYSHVPKPAQASDIDWKSFLGSAPDQPFDPVRRTYWRWFWDFGGGHLTDLFSHWVDVIHWYIGESSPDAVAALGTRNLFPEFECPDTITATYQYPKGYNVVHTGSLAGSIEDGNILFRGSKGMLRVNRGGYAVFDERTGSGGRALLPPPALLMESTRDGTVDHVQNFLDCVRSRAVPNAPVVSSVAAARAAHLGNLAYRKRPTA